MREERGIDRAERTACCLTDDHDRFPATASLAQRAGFLDRPIIDEYVEILWTALHQSWASLQRKTG